MITNNTIMPTKCIGCDRPYNKQGRFAGNVFTPNSKWIPLGGCICFDCFHTPVNIPRTPKYTQSPLYDDILVRMPECPDCNKGFCFNWDNVCRLCQLISVARSVAKKWVASKTKPITKPSTFTKTNLFGTDSYLSLKIDRTKPVPSNRLTNEINVLFNLFKLYPERNLLKCNLKK